MDAKGDIPARDAIEPPAALGQTAQAKVAVVDEILNSGTAHVYLVSTPDAEGDKHLHGYNTHRFPDLGWIFFHGDDLDKWIPGDDIGLIERHYE